MQGSEVTNAPIDARKNRNQTNSKVRWKREQSAKRRRSKFFKFCPLYKFFSHFSWLSAWRILFLNLKMKYWSYVNLEVTYFKLRINKKLINLGEEMCKNMRFFPNKKLHRKKEIRILRRLTNFLRITYNLPLGRKNLAMTFGRLKNFRVLIAKIPFKRSLKFNSDN